MTKREIGENYFKSGYNCAQSVVLTYADEIGIDKEKALLISSSFGGGMGRLCEVCGAFSGMLIVLGALKGYSENNNPTKKQEYYKVIQSLAEKFKNINGSIICRDLLASGKKPCGQLVGDAIDILEEYLNNN